jgi:hypothetical protein
MKKVVFSLVAFMAFSVSAFANTVEVKEEVVEVKEEVVVIDCYEEAAAMENLFWAFMPTGLTISNGQTLTAYDVFLTAYEDCEASGGCSYCWQGN